VLADITSWDLPDDVFDTKAGEVKPSKPVKKVMKPSKVETKPAVRRSINEVEVCLRLQQVMLFVLILSSGW
jgi:hypothetical protein